MSKQPELKEISEVQDGEFAYVAKWAFTVSSENPDDSTMYINTSHPFSSRRWRRFCLKVRRVGDVFEISVFDAYRVLFSKAFRREVATTSDVCRLFGAIHGGDSELCAVKPIPVWRLK